MVNLPKELRQRLEADFCLGQGRPVKKQTSRDGTVKLLLQWADGARTETVLILDRRRRTVCISSQVGCAVRCFFCASGKSGLERSLQAGEMVEQVRWAGGELDPPERMSHVVIMGMGEPLANYQETLKAVKIINARWGFGIGARHITLSTIGLPKQIKKLAHEPIQITLAVSLHAGDDALRQKLIPWAKDIPLKELFEALDYYYQKTHREVTLEYVLLEGVNDALEDADRLAQWARRSRCHVNLINYNRVEGCGYRAVSAKAARAFMVRLKQRAINVHLRRSRGTEIEAACGQLQKRAGNSNG